MTVLTGATADVPRFLLLVRHPAAGRSGTPRRSAAEVPGGIGSCAARSAPAAASAGVAWVARRQRHDRRVRPGGRAAAPRRRRWRRSPGQWRAPASGTGTQRWAEQARCSRSRSLTRNRRYRRLVPGRRCSRGIRARAQVAAHRRRAAHGLAATPAPAYDGRDDRPRRRQQRRDAERLGGGCAMRYVLWRLVRFFACLAMGASLLCSSAGGRR